MNSRSTWPGAPSPTTPSLAICRGVQVPNVAAGQRSCRTSPRRSSPTSTHSVAEPKNLECHDIAVAPGSKLAQTSIRKARRAAAGSTAATIRRSAGRGPVWSSARLPPTASSRPSKRPGIASASGAVAPGEFLADRRVQPLFEEFVNAAREQVVWGTRDVSRISRRRLAIRRAVYSERDRIPRNDAMRYPASRSRRRHAPSSPDRTTHR